MKKCSPHDDADIEQISVLFKVYLSFKLRVFSSGSELSYHLQIKIKEIFIRSTIYFFILHQELLGRNVIFFSKNFIKHNFSAIGSVLLSHPKFEGSARCYCWMQDIKISNRFGPQWHNIHTKSSWMLGEWFRSCKKEHLRRIIYFLKGGKLARNVKPPQNCTAERKKYADSFDYLIWCRLPTVNCWCPCYDVAMWGIKAGS